MESITPAKHKKPKKIFDRRSIFFSAWVLILFAILIGVELKKHMPQANLQSSASVKIDYRALASKLQAVGLNKEAAQAYTLYLEQGADLSDEAAAKIAYTVGKIYLDEGNFESALKAFYQVELYDPDTELKSEVGTKIVHCLERLNRGVAAQYALDARTRLNDKTDEAKTGGAVIAEIGSDTVSLVEVEEALSDLPPYLKKQFEGEKGRMEFAQKFVAEELLYRKATKLEYDKLPEIRKQIDRFTRELAVQKIIQTEVQDKVQLTDADLELYYKAHLDRYKDAEQIKIHLLQATSLEEAKEIRQKLEEKGDVETFETLAKARSIHEKTKAAGGKFDAWIAKNTDPLGLGDPQQWRELFTIEPGFISQPLTIGDKFYLFRLDEKNPERQKSFDDVKAQVSREYRTEKMQSAYETLIQQTLTDNDVKFHPEVLQKEKTATTEDKG